MRSLVVGIIVVLGLAAVGASSRVVTVDCRRPTFGAVVLHVLRPGSPAHDDELDSVAACPALDLFTSRARPSVAVDCDHPGSVVVMLHYTGDVERRFTVTGLDLCDQYAPRPWGPK